MAKRMILMLVAVAVFIGGIAAVKTRQIQKGMKQNASFQPPPEAVTTIVAKQERWPESLTAVGSAVAVHGVTLSADLPGIVERLPFESGQLVKQGTVVAELDTRQERAQLAAAQAQLKLTTINLDRWAGLKEQGVAAQADYDKAVADKAQAEATVGEIQATIARKTIRAPFSGVLGIRQANLGQYLAAGAPIVPLQSLDPIYVHFSIPQQQMPFIRVGADVNVTTENDPKGFAGKVTAVDSLIDPATRNVQVEATLRNPGGKLRPGMFVESRVHLGASEPVISLPASAINYAPYGNSVFVVKTMKNPAGKQYQGVEQQFVKIGSSRGDQVAITSGIEAGQQIVTSGVFKLRNGAAVQINNNVQPANNPAPKPEDS